MYNSKDTTILIFSKDRAMQLDLCLISLYEHMEDQQLPQIIVIFKGSNLDHIESYETIREEHPYAELWQENNFHEDVWNALSDKKYVLFVTDDTIFCDNFSLEKYSMALDTCPDHLGISLRLGKNTVYCYPHDRMQKIPEFYHLFSDLLTFDWENAEYDFSYPLELSSSFYRISDLLPFLKMEYKNPNDLEALLFYCRYAIGEEMPYMFCHENSIAFASPVNRVQNVAYLNRFGENKAYYSDSLLTKYANGYRIDHNKFNKYLTHGAHEEVEFEFIKSIV